MEKIQEFLKKVFSLERQAIEAENDSEVEFFNKLFEKLIGFSKNQAIRFNMSYLTKEEDDLFDDFPEFTDFKESKPIMRHIFKISKYKHDYYTNVFICYVSTRNPLPNIFSYSNCYLVSCLNKKFEIISQYTFGDSDLLKSTWSFTGGDRNITFDNLGKPIKILRLLAPQHDPDSVEDYLKDN